LGAFLLGAYGTNKENRLGAFLLGAFLLGAYGTMHAISICFQLHETFFHTIRAFVKRILLLVP